MPTQGRSLFTFLDLESGFTSLALLKITDRNGGSLSRRNITAQADTKIREHHVFSYAVAAWDIVVDIPGRRVDYRARRFNFGPWLPGSRWGTLSGYNPGYPRYRAPDAGMYDSFVPRIGRFGRFGRTG